MIAPKIVRLDFFGHAGSISLNRALAYRFAAKLGTDRWAYMKPAGRRFLRRLMRHNALEAVIAAKAEAAQRAKEAAQ